MGIRQAELAGLPEEELTGARARVQELGTALRTNPQLHVPTEPGRPNPAWPSSGVTTVPNTELQAPPTDPQLPGRPNPAWQSSGVTTVPNTELQVPPTEPQLPETYPRAPDTDPQLGLHFDLSALTT